MFANMFVSTFVNKFVIANKFMITRVWRRATLSLFRQHGGDRDRQDIRIRQDVCNSGRSNKSLCYERSRGTAFARHVVVGNTPSMK